MTSAFRINTPPVVAEILDGEATIVDLDQGIYYALNESGSFIWDQLASGVGTDRVAAELASRYGVPAEQAATDTHGLVNELRERNLIVPGNGGGTRSSNGSTPHNGTRPYSTPELSVYTDMQELLLLDPVHEVDDTGWPSRT